MLNPYPKLPPLERLRGVVERASKQPVTRAEYEAWTAAKDTLERAAPVIASDLIALAEVIAWVRQTVDENDLAERDPDDAIEVSIASLLGASAALSTVLAHIDDSLPIEGEGEGRSRARERSAGQSVGDEPVLEGAPE